MEAATPLRKPHVRTVGERLAVDGLVVGDQCAVRLVREREEAGDDPVGIVTDALEIGARVLDREQTGANVEFVKNEFQNASREIETAFAERAKTVADEMANAFERYFSDGSSTAVQNRVRELVGEVMTRSREDLRKQFSASDESNPLADFRERTIAVLRSAEERQHSDLQKIGDKMAALEKELHALRAEREKLEELEAERERGTAKGRTFEELVVEAIDEIAVKQGDETDAVGDRKGATRKTGDVIVDIEACNGPAMGRIVFEAKTAKISRQEAFRQLDQAKAERVADFAVLVVASDEKLPAKTHPLRMYNGDKLIVSWDPEEGSRIALEVAYALARARVLMSRGGADAVDSAAIRDTIERALGAMEDVRKVKSQLTGAKTSIDNAREILETMAGAVREHLRDIESLVAAGAGADSGQQQLVA
jgi:hypothetical protein